MFCSTSVWVHLVRGIAAAAMIAGVFFVQADYPILIIPLLIGAVVLLRGCPMCWLIGLFETARNQRIRRNPPSGDQLRS